MSQTRLICNHCGYVQIHCHCNMIHSDPINIAFCHAWKNLQAALYATHQEKGFAMPPDSPVIWDGNQIALMHGELSEAHEALRKDLMDDKITHRKGVEVELADVVIRIMNYATDRGLDVAGAIVEKAAFNKSRPFMHGGKKF